MCHIYSHMLINAQIPGVSLPWSPPYNMTQNQFHSVFVLHNCSKGIWNYSLLSWHLFLALISRLHWPHKNSALGGGFFMFDRTQQ